MIGRKRGRPPKKQYFNRGPHADPSLPLSTIPRELFCQAVARGIKVKQAYADAGFKGKDSAVRQLRASRDVDNRIRFLLQDRIDSDHKARHQRETPHANRRDRILKRLEDIAFSDIRDVAQWRTVPIYDDDGSIIGTRPEIVITPSSALSAAQAASIKRVFTKSGETNIEWSDPIAALEKLAKIEGLFVDGGPSSITNNTTVNQVTLGARPAGDLIRRIAFAIQKAAHSQALIDVTPASEPVTHAIEDDRKE